MTSTGHNSMPDRATFFAHLNKVQAAAALAEADADFSQAKKLAKADGIVTEDLKYVMDAIATEDPSIVLERLRRQANYCEWLSIMPRGQADMFADRRPADEADYQDGLADGLLGKSADDARGAEYMRGWSDGQAELAKGFKATEKPAVTLVVNNDKAPADPFDDAAETAAVN